MKRLLSFAMALFAMSTVAFAQSPQVTISVDSVTATTITASFDKNDACSDYYFVIAEEGEMAQWVGMGATLEQLITAWGVRTLSDTSYTWTDMAPSSNYVIYVVANSASESVVDSLATMTAIAGGSGESVISIEVFEISQSSARVVCTPNDQTAVFYDQLIEKSLVDEIGMDSAMAIVQQGLYPMYEVDDWVWAGLNPGTEIYAFAQGKNADDVWGPLAMQLFTTLQSTDGIVLAKADRINVYPNPTAEKVVVEVGDLKADVVELYDMAGRIVMDQNAQNVKEVVMNIADLPAGNYLVRVAQKGQRGATAVIVKQ